MYITISLSHSLFFLFRFSILVPLIKTFTNSTKIYSIKLIMIFIYNLFLYYFLIQHFYYTRFFERKCASNLSAGCRLVAIFVASYNKFCSLEISSLVTKGSSHTPFLCCDFLICVLNAR